jgi:hypothetical protein
MVVLIYNPSNVGGIARKIMIKDWLWAKVRPYLKNNYKQKGLLAWLEW